MLSQLTYLPRRLGSKLVSLPQRFWFRPLLILVGAISLLFLGQAFLPHSEAFNELIQTWMKPELARSVLTTLAGSTATVMALVFSMTFVAMSTVASQLGPRLLYEIDADPVTQWIAGLFLSTFAVAIIGLLQPVTPGSDQGGQVIVALITAGLAFISLAALVYYIHHLARQLTSDVVLQRRAEAFKARLATIFTEKRERYDAPTCPIEDGTALLARASGYVDQIDRKAITQCAKANGLTITVEIKPGQFVIENRPLMTAAPSGLRLEVSDTLRDAVVLSAERRFTQDIEKDLDSILEIMLRALSPGINDPYTAIAGIHQIGSALARVFGKHRQDAWQQGEEDARAWEVYFRGTSIGDLVEKVGRTLRPYVAPNPIVVDALLLMLSDLEQLADDGPLRRVINAEKQHLTAAAHVNAGVDADKPEAGVAA